MKGITMKETLITTKNLVVKHRAKIAFTAGFIACFAVTQSARNDWNEFLKEQNLFDEYYSYMDELA